MPLLEPLTTADAPPGRSRWVIRGVLVVVTLGIIAAAVMYLPPVVRRWLNTVSTDDAYVNGHYTLVAARVAGQVKRVLVDDNYRVKAGEVLLELDPVPFQVIVDVRKAGVATAEADRVAAAVQVRATIAQARSQRFKLQGAIEQVNNQTAVIKARVAVLKSRQAVLVDAQANLARDKELFDKAALGKQEYDKTTADAKVAQALVAQALEEVYEARVALGLPARPEGGDLATVPADLSQTYSTVRQALAELVQSLSLLGYPLAPVQDTPQQFLDKLHAIDDGGNTEVLLAKLMETAPAIKQTDAKLEQARRDLAQAELNLSYCTVVAEIDGVITRRSVNPGNNVVAGQQVMIIRSLTQIWIDANFKETELDLLTIGQRVDLEVDMYGSRRKFTGRISGFTYGTGQTLALLPPQNATGNFVKVVQRLPVRIDLENYDPNADDPLFAGLSVVPYVFYKEPPTGPNAGKRLQALRAGR